MNTTNKGPLSQPKVFLSGEEFFGHLLASIKLAQSSIDLEYYIFDWDELGQRIYSALLERAQAGVMVRICIDGIGSYYWPGYPTHELFDAGGEQRIYHPVPWAFSRVFPSRSSDGILQRIFHLNRRNHKKACIIDEKVAYAGSMNVTINSIDWKETGLRVVDDDAKVLSDAFQHTWTVSNPVGRQGKDPWTKRKKAKEAVLGSDTIRLNQRLKLRLGNYNKLVKEILAAQSRVWITNAYFVPPPKLLDSLCKAAIKGADVRLLLPGISDVFFVRWVSRYYYRRLIKSGVRIYEYNKTVLHAKVTIIDHRALVGSSNYNYRSIYQDLEVDVVTDSPASVETLTKDFENSIRLVEEIEEENLKKRPFLELILGRIFLLFKWWF